MVIRKGQPPTTTCQNRHYRQHRKQVHEVKIITAVLPGKTAVIYVEDLAQQGVFGRECGDSDRQGI